MHIIFLTSTFRFSKKKKKKKVSEITSGSNATKYTLHKQSVVAKPITMTKNLKLKIKT